MQQGQRPLPRSTDASGLPTTRRFRALEPERRFFLISWTLLLLAVAAARAQEKSVKPGVNEQFKNPDVERFQKVFETESREVYAQRAKIAAACDIKPGMIVADIGAGTGIYTRLFARTVGERGQVYAVDIAAKFLEHIQKTSRQAGLHNVTPVLCNEDSVCLPPSSVDTAFVCDTYHHFEYPQKTLASIYRALKPAGKLIIVDFIRVPGKSSAWVLSHVRAGQGVVEKELSAAGFHKAREVKGLLQETYMIIFTKPMPGQ